MACKRASNSAKTDTKTASDHAAADSEKAKRVWAKFNPEVSATQCTACSHFDMPTKQETLQNGALQTSEETTLGTGTVGRKLQNSTMPFEDRL